MDIGNRIRQLRLGRGLSETHLETRTGIPRSHLVAVEEGREKPSLDTLEAWAKVLGVEMHQLFLPSKPTLLPRQRDNIGTLSAREKKLIQVFRSLTPADQKDLLFVGKKMAGPTHKRKVS